MTPAFLQNELVRAFCWTLIHSLWQGLILAAITGLVLLLTRRSHAKKRYALLSVLFFLFLLVTLGTFIRELGAVKPAGVLPVSSDHLIELALTADISEQTRASDLAVVNQGWVQRFIDYFNTHAAMVVTIWFIVFFAKLVRLGGNLFYIQRLRSYRTRQPADQWKRTLSQLAERLGVQMQIQLLESAIVKVPVTMGILKPVILLPLGLLAHLPADEIEAILLHELAHIKRRDYFVNLLQSLAETIFFFNPALLWLSAMIRDERENCCDDIAIAITNNKTNFINALISFQEYHFAKPPYGMAFPGKKQQLLNRVKRIVNNSNKTLNAAEKSILGFGMALLLLFSFVTTQQSPVKPLEPQKQSGSIKAASPVKSDKTKKESGNDQEFMQATLPMVERKDAVLVDTTTPVSPKEATPAVEAVSADVARIAAKAELAQDTSIKDNFSSFSISVDYDGDTRTMVLGATTVDGKKYSLKKVNNVMEAFSIDGKQIPPAEFNNYKAEIEQLETAYRNRNQRSKMRRDADMRKRQEQREKLDRAIALKLDRIKEERVREDAKREIRLEQKRLDLEKHLREHKERMLRHADSTREHREEIIKKKVELSIEHNKALKEHMDKDMEIKIEQKNRKLAHVRLDSLNKLSRIKEDRIGADRKAEWMRARQEEDEAHIKASASIMRNIIDDLEKENIKIDTQKSWFALDNNRFIVDGKDMSKDMHEKFRSKYISRNGWGYYYGHVQVSGRGIFLDNKDVPAK